MIFGMLNPEKIWHEILQICPSHLSDVATWEIQKSYFRQRYSYDLLIIIYIISQENKL